MLDKIISGGQTGADRAALDVAIRHKLPHGGWCPAGRRAEDGPIGAQYALTETPTADYLERNEWNVRDSDGTAILTIGSVVTGGSLATVRFAVELGKPHICLSSASDQPARALADFIERNGIRCLNVAGSRESDVPGTYRWVTQILEDAIFRD